MDQAQQMMDSRERIVLQRLSAEYKKAEKELQKELNEYFKRFQKQDKEKSKLVSQGKLDQSEYIKWRKNKMLYKETLSQKVDVMSQHLLNVNKQARDIIRKEMFGVYADQYNFGKYEVEKGLKVNTSFTLFDQKTVERMAEKNPKLLPEREAPDGKVLKYSRRKVNTAITQGVLQGESIDKIAQRLSKVVGMEERYALTNARTAMTGAQNAGRLDSYFDSKKLGINIKKQWMATLDERTRTSHQELDGEIVDIEKKFSNGLEYPGDPEGHPREVYNCRCTMIADLPDFPPQNMMRLDNVNGTPIEYVTYKEWADAHRTTKEFTRSGVVWSESGQSFRNKMESEGVSYNLVNELKEKLSDADIIERIAGADKTTGSCFSTACAYIGNKIGLDVLDFRGGKATKQFAGGYVDIVKLRGINAIVMEGNLTNAKKLLTFVEEGKEYLYTGGRHTAIVRKKDGVLQYLELQSEAKGWKNFEDDNVDARALYLSRKTTISDTLKRRFKAKGRMCSHNYLVDINDFNGSDEFRDLLGYVNTSKGKQKKGVGGSAK